MFDVHATPGDLTEFCIDDYPAQHGQPPLLTEPRPARQTALLGPNGEPLEVDIPRRVIGFDLTPKRP